jgi:hypothetical protein
MLSRASWVAERATAEEILDIVWNNSRVRNFSADVLRAAWVRLVRTGDAPSTERELVRVDRTRLRRSLRDRYSYVIRTVERERVGPLWPAGRKHYGDVFLDRDGILFEVSTSWDAIWVAGRKGAAVGPGGKRAWKSVVPPGGSSDVHDEYIAAADDPEVMRTQIGLGGVISAPPYTYAVLQALWDKSRPRGHRARSSPP